MLSLQEGEEKQEGRNLVPSWQVYNKASLLRLFRFPADPRALSRAET